jgi:hypothetical protein
MAPPDKRSRKKESKREKGTDAGGDRGAPDETKLAEEKEGALLVAELNPHDVLFGRTADTVNYQGNLRFREMVHARKKAYMGTGRHRAKDEIAREIISTIHRLGGRFLMRVEPPPAASSQNAGSSSAEEREEVKYWSIASEAQIAQKVKQALREKDSSSNDPSETGGQAPDIPLRVHQPSAVGSGALERPTHIDGGLSQNNAAFLGGAEGNNILGETSRATGTILQDPLSILRQDNLGRQPMDLFGQQQGGNESDRTLLLQLQQEGQLDHPLQQLQQQIQQQRLLQQQQQIQQRMALESNALQYLPSSQGALMQASPLVDPNWLLRSSALTAAVQQQQQQRQQQLLSSSMVNGLAFPPFASTATGTSAVDDSTLRLALNTALWQQTQHSLGGINNIQNSAVLLSSLAPSFGQLSATSNLATVGGLAQIPAVTTPTSVLSGQQRQQFEETPNESSSNRRLISNSTATAMRATNEELDGAQTAVARLPLADRSTFSPSERAEAAPFVGRQAEPGGNGKARARENRGDSGSPSTSTSSSITDEPTQSSCKKNKRKRKS